MLFIRRAYIFLVFRNPLCLADAFTGVSLYSPSGCTIHLVVIEPVRLNDNFLVLVLYSRLTSLRLMLSFYILTDLK